MYEEHDDIVYVLKYQAYQENYFHTIFWSQHHGKISVFLPKKLTPRYLYQYHITWKKGKSLKPLEMTIRHIHTLQGLALLSSYYVLEFMLTLTSDNNTSTGLSDILACRLAALENVSNTQELERILRIYERQSLAHLGYGLNVAHITDIKEAYICYDPHTGYSGYPIAQPSQLCLPRSTLYCILTDQYDDVLILKSAKKWFQSILALLLPQYQWKCRSLFHRLPESSS